MPVRFVIKHKDIIYVVSDISPHISKKNFSYEHINMKRFKKNTLFSYINSNELTHFIRTHEYLFRINSDKALNREGIYRLIKESFAFYKKENLIEFHEDILNNRFFIITQDDIFQIFNSKVIVEIADYASYNDYEFILFDYMLHHDIRDDIFLHIDAIMNLLQIHFNDIQSNYVILNNKNEKLIWKDQI